MPRWATFDCYGTLIDWNGGISATLERLWPDEDARALLASYHALEPVVQRECPVLSYRGVLARCLRGIADAEGLALAVEDEGSLGNALPGWPVFPEVPGALAELRRGGWSLAILFEHGRRSPRGVGRADRRAVRRARGRLRDRLVQAGARALARVLRADGRPARGARACRGEPLPRHRAGMRGSASPRCGSTGSTSGRRSQPTRELPDLSGLPDILRELVP